LKWTREEPQEAITKVERDCLLSWCEAAIEYKLDEAHWHSVEDHCLVAMAIVAPRTGGFGKRARGFPRSTACGAQHDAAAETFPNLRKFGPLGE